MDNELIRMAAGAELTSYRDRAVARRAKRNYDDVRLKALQADGAFALAGHIMAGARGLDDERRSLSGGDPLTDTVLMEFEAEAIRQARSIQRSLNDAWGI